MDPPMVRATGPATVGGGESADRKLVMEFSSDVLRRSRQRAERKRPHGGFTSGCSLWFAHAGQEAHLHDRGGPDAGSGRGGQLGDLRAQTDVFEDVSVIVLGPTNLTGAKQPEHLEMMEVSPNYFSMLGATPELGRLFSHQDFALGFAPVVVISDGLWRRSYGADPGVLGRSL